MTVEEIINGLRAPDQAGAGRVDRLDHGDSLDQLLALEAKAVSIWSLDSQVIPGLLQTGPYAAAIIRRANRRLPGAEVRRRMLLKSARMQQLWGRMQQSRAPEVRFVIGSAAIDRIGWQITDGGRQFQHILKVAALPRCVVQVLPSTLVTPGLTEHYTVYGLRSKEEGRRYLVYQETAMGGWYTTRPADLEPLQTAWDDAMREAMTPGDSVRYIERMLRLWTEPRRRG